MKVLLVSHELTVTGAPNSLLRQAKYFRSAGFEVEVWSLAEGPLRARYQEAGFTPKLVANDRRAIQIKYEMDPIRYDLVVCNTIKSYRCVDVLMRYGLKIAWFIRETKLVDEDFWLDRDFARLFSKFYNLYTVSEYAAEVVRYYNPNVKVIHNAVADVFDGFAPPCRHLRFGFIGSLIEVKGVGLLVKAFQRVIRDFPDVTLTIAGGVPAESFARLQAETRDIPRVSLLGTVQGEEKRRFFDSIDVLCVPSLDEPSGLTVIEGAMLGKPVITTDRTGANYLVDEGSGRCVRAGDVDSLAEALRDFAGMDAQTLRTYCENSRKMYLRYGTPEVECLNVVKMVAESRPAPPVLNRLRYDDETPWFHESHFANGTRRWYFRNLRLITLPGKGPRVR